MDTIQKIRVELSKRDISPSYMMKELGFSSGLYSQWKNRKQKPSIGKLKEIAKYLNVTLDYLLDDDTSNINHEYSYDDIALLENNLMRFKKLDVNTQKLMLDFYDGISNTFK